MPEPEGRQLSATTHWTFHPPSDKERERVRRTQRWRSKFFVWQGVLFVVIGLVAALWLLTAHTVTATATRCGEPHKYHHHLVSKCTMSWTDSGRARSATQTLDQPGALGSRDRLAVDGLGTSGHLNAGSAKLIAGLMLGAGVFWLSLGLLSLRYDKRSGRTADQLGR